MRRAINIFTIIVFCLVITGRTGFAQTSASATGQIFAEVIAVCSAEETAPLNFGKIAPGVYGGEVILSPASTVSLLGSVFKGTGGHSAASFFVSGEEGAAYSVTLPSGPVRITHINSARTMIVDNWQSNPGPGYGTGTLEGGAQTVYVGATLKMGSLQDNPPGIYTGAYTITFDFN